MNRKIGAATAGLALAIGIGLIARMPLPGASPRRGLNVYLIDVEGGAATLIVTPARQAVLIDGGWSTKDLRDSKRVRAAMKDAGVNRVDYMIASHYHPDHLGGVVELASQIPVGEFLDRGPMEKPMPYVSQDLYSKYMELSKGRRRAVHPGERIELKGNEGGPAPSLFVLSSNGATYRNGRGEKNLVCAGAKEGPPDTGENENSVGVLLQFGDFRYLDLADLTGKLELQLVCPTNVIGDVNVYQVDHHGKETSNNSTFIASIHPQAALMNNGATKGGDASVMGTLKGELAPDDIFQLHRNLHIRAQDNAEPENIANPDDNDGGFGFEVRVNPDGKSYRIINERTQSVRRYSTARKPKQVTKRKKSPKAA